MISSEILSAILLVIIPEIPKLIPSEICLENKSKLSPETRLVF